MGDTITPHRQWKSANVKFGYFLGGTVGFIILINAGIGGLILWITLGIISYYSFTELIELVELNNCSICGQEFNVLKNQKYSLLSNLNKLGIVDQKIEKATYICDKCFTDMYHVLCDLCKKPFLLSSNHEDEINSHGFRKWFEPYHSKRYASRMKYVCPICFSQYQQLASDVQRRLQKWVAGVKIDFIRGHRIIKELGRVEVNTACKDPNEVEEKLKLYTVQIGGNAFIKFYWQPHSERKSERVIAGYGPQGNPYYKSNSWLETWSTGYGVAVQVVPETEMQRKLPYDNKTNFFNIEIKRSYSVLSNNDVKFGIRVTNKNNYAFMDMDSILDYPKTLFSIKDSEIQHLGNITPNSSRTVTYILKPLGCIHNEKISTILTFKDPAGKKHTQQMRPKEVHCVCPFLKEKPMGEGEYSRLAEKSEYVLEGLAFKGISVDDLAKLMGETCRNALYKIKEYDIDGKKIIYLSGESLGEGAYYLLTVVIQEYKGSNQVVLRAHSDKKYGLNGFMKEITDSIRNLVGSVQSAKEIGNIENTQVINIIDSVVQRTSFSAGGGVSSVNIRESVVQRTEINGAQGIQKGEEGYSIDEHCESNRQNIELKRQEGERRLRIEKMKQEIMARQKK